MIWIRLLNMLVDRHQLRSGRLKCPPKPKGLKLQLRWIKFRVGHKLCYNMGRQVAWYLMIYLYSEGATGIWTSCRWKCNLNSQGWHESWGELPYFPQWLCWLQVQIKDPVTGQFVLYDKGYIAKQAVNKHTAHEDTYFIPPSKTVKFQDE